MRNGQVIAAWLRGDIAGSANLTTNGKDIYSYQLKIGETRNGEKVAFDYTSGGLREYYSQTTSKHVGMIKRCADIIE